MMLKELFMPQFCRIKMVTDKDIYNQGDLIRGFIQIKCGKKQYKVNHIKLKIYIDYINGQKKKERFLYKEDIIIPSFVTYSYDNRQIPFQYQLPLDIPLTSSYLIVTIESQTEVYRSLSDKSSKVIKTIPFKEVKSILNTLQYNLNFQPTYRSGMFINGSQLFEFRDTGLFQSQGLDTFIFYYKYDEFYIHLHCEIIVQNKRVNFKHSLFRPQLYSHNNLIDQEFLQNEFYRMIISHLL